MQNNIKVNDKVMAGVKELIQNISYGIVYYEGQLVKINGINCIVNINNKEYSINKALIYSLKEWNELKGGVR
jgi:hypothetical protein